MASHANTPKILAEKRIKQQVVIDIITNHLIDSEREIFRHVHQVIADGSELKCFNLAAGGTNYSYKVCVEDKPNLSRVLTRNTRWNVP